MNRHQPTRDDPGDTSAKGDQVGRTGGRIAWVSLLALLVATAACTERKGQDTSRPRASARTAVATSQPAKQRRGAADGPKLRAQPCRAFAEAWLPGIQKMMQTFVRSVERDPYRRSQLATLRTMHFNFRRAKRYPPGPELAKRMAGRCQRHLTTKQARCLGQTTFDASGNPRSFGANVETATTCVPRDRLLEVIQTDLTDRTQICQVVADVALGPAEAPRALPGGKRPSAADRALLVQRCVTCAGADAGDLLCIGRWQPGNRTPLSCRERINRINRDARGAAHALLAAALAPATASWGAGKNARPVVSGK